MHAAAAIAVTLAALAPVPPAPARWVEDRVAFLSTPVRDGLDRRLEAYQRETGHQVVVWIGDTLAGEPLDAWAVRTFAAWKVGRAGIDDGVVVFVLASDRAIDIEVGYGLEDRVPDAVAARVIHEVMAPSLRRGERDAAVTAGVDALLAAIDGRPWTAPPGPTRDRVPEPVSTVLAVLLAIAFLVLLVKRPRLALFLLGTMLGRGGRGGGGGGGFRGAGGRSGGGGARGHW